MISRRTLAALAVGFAVFSGLDKALEAQLVEWSPAWLDNLTTRF